MPEHRIVKYREKWAVTFTDEGGQRVRRSLGTDDLEEAKRRLPAFLRQMEMPADLTVKHLWDAYRKDKDGKRIAGNMEYSGKPVLAEFGQLRPEDITVAACRAYARARRAKGRKPGTVWTELNHLRIVMNWAVKMRHIPEQVYVELPQKPPPRDRRLTREEAYRLQQAAEPEHVKVAITLMLGTAARKGAVLDLTWDRVDFERGLITYADVKDDELRKGRATVRMNAMVRRELMKARKGALSPYVVEWAGKKVGSIKRGFAASVDRAGLEGVTPHVLRHTAATIMAEAGRPMTEIAAVLGHSDSSITERVYAKFSPAYLKESTDALDLEGVPFDVIEPDDENKK
ncbi:site-specific integrase [Xanthobacter autotrophicus]|uniref:site-specific integrase n=1 Tax=Xanthobacter autotrophicus TaxID=280 RepID=UPI00372C5DA6